MVLGAVSVFGVIQRESDKNFFVSISDRRANMLTTLIIGWKKLDTTTKTSWATNRRLARQPDHYTTYQSYTLTHLIAVVD